MGNTCLPHGGRFDLCPGEAANILPARQLCLCEALGWAGLASHQRRAGSPPAT